MGRGKKRERERETKKEKMTMRKREKRKNGHSITIPRYGSRGWRWVMGRPWVCSGILGTRSHCWRSELENGWMKSRGRGRDEEGGSGSGREEWRDGGEGERERRRDKSDCGLSFPALFRLQEKCDREVEREIGEGGDGVREKSKSSTERDDDEMYIITQGRWTTGRGRQRRLSCEGEDEDEECTEDDAEADGRKSPGTVRTVGIWSLNRRSSHNTGHRNRMSSGNTENTA